MPHKVKCYKTAELVMMGLERFQAVEGKACSFAKRVHVGSKNPDPSFTQSICESLIRVHPATAEEKWTHLHRKVDPP